MKAIIPRLICLLVGVSVLALTSCVGPNPFTAPADPVTGIRQDIPRDPETGEKLWAEPDPLDFPGDEWGQASSHPLLTWQGRNDFFFGHPGSF